MHHNAITRGSSQATGNKHNNFVKISWMFLSYVSGQTNRQTYRHAHHNISDLSLQLVPFTVRKAGEGSDRHEDN